MFRIMPSKSTRAFRTISEAGDELDLQPHVLRFWESKFSQIQPMKRSGGRRFYRPEDIEFLRGIKILLHREKHPIKDVQKLIRVRGAQSVVDLGRAKAQAARPKDIKDTDLVPKRIKAAVVKKATTPQPVQKPVPQPVPRLAPIQVAAPEVIDTEILRRPSDGTPATPRNKPKVMPVEVCEPSHDGRMPPASVVDREKLKTALSKLRSLQSRWEEYK